MSIRGSLETFSLPELFQIIGSGKKSGRLQFTPHTELDDPQDNTTFKLWFKKGYFIAITNSSQYQALIEKIQEKNWIDSMVLVKNKYLCPANKAFGTYLKENNLLNEAQREWLFDQQISQVYKLFKIKDGSFNLEEINEKNKIASDGEEFPVKEMTGKKRKIIELSLAAMRNFSDWARFAEDIPPAETGLRKVASSCDLQLTSLEKHIWNSANGSISLKKLAKQKEVDLQAVQRTTLSMIFAGLVEETRVVSPAEQFISNPTRNLSPAFAGGDNVALKSKTKSKASKSLISNLVSFLKDNF